MYENNEQPNRKIVISTNIDEEVAERVIMQITDINEFDNHMSIVNTYKPEPIEMFINSAGGVVTDGFAIIGAMEMSHTPIKTYGLGQISSMALGIFVSGDIRIAHRYARFMYHSVSYGAEGFIKYHEEAHKEAELAQSMYDNLFKNTKLSGEMMSRIRKNKANFYFSGEEAVRLEIADKIMLNRNKK